MQATNWAPEHSDALRKVRTPRPRRSREGPAAEPVQQKPVSLPAEPVKLRCVGVKPRLLSLMELERGDCRYPYGGDKGGRGHSSHCTPHFQLTRGWAPPRSGQPVRSCCGWCRRLDAEFE